MSAPTSNPPKFDDKLDELRNSLWMIRKPCDIYFLEHKDCQNRLGRRHQKFTVGYEYDCSKWKEDYDNCERFEVQGDTDAAFQIVQNEKVRREERLKAGANNDIWEYRDSPPEDWSKTIPGWDEKSSPLLKMYSEGTRIPYVEPVSCNIL